MLLEMRAGDTQGAPWNNEFHGSGSEADAQVRCRRASVQLKYSCRTPERRAAAASVSGLPAFGRLPKECVEVHEFPFQCDGLVLHDPMLRKRPQEAHRHELHDKECTSRIHLTWLSRVRKRLHLEVELDELVAHPFAFLVEAKYAGFLRRQESL